MPTTPVTQLTTEQAINRARRMIASGRNLTQAAEAVSVFRQGAARDGAEAVKEQQLLSYRVTTVPSELEPVLEALILAASGAATAAKELQHAAS